MKKSIKAVLLSGLVLPGLGQLYLKRWVSGFVLSGVAVYAVYFIGSVVVSTTLDLTQKIESGAIPADIETVSRLVSQQLSGSEQSTNLATMAFGASWVIGIIGAYWYGRKQDRVETKAKHGVKEKNDVDI
jgi:TM2 domain-containing membrane protein YozV